MLKQYISNEKASIFIVILWSLCLLGFFAIGLGARIAQDINVAAYLQDEPRARYLAEAGIENARVILSADKNTFDSLNEPWGKGLDFKLGSGSYEVEIKDEESKININTAKVDVLERMLRLVGGLDLDSSRMLADSMIDWRDIDNNPSEGIGAENDYYRSLIKPYDCKNKNYQVTEELLLVKGMTEDVFMKIKDFITIYGDGKININTASRESLEALGMSSSLAQKIIAYRKGSDSIAGTQDDNIIQNPHNMASDINRALGLREEESVSILNIILKGVLSISSNNFLIRAKGQIGKRTEQIVCVVEKRGRVRSWRE